MCIKHLYQGCKVYDKGCKLFIVRGGCKLNCVSKE